jgi:hypothetical protein
LWWPSYGLIIRDGDDVSMQEFRMKALLDACIEPTSVVLSGRPFSSLEAWL